MMSTTLTVLSMIWKQPGSHSSLCSQVSQECCTLLSMQNHFTQTKAQIQPTADTVCPGPCRPDLDAEEEISGLRRVKLLQIKLERNYRGLLRGNGFILLTVWAADMYVQYVFMYYEWWGDSSRLLYLWFFLMERTDGRSPEAEGWRVWGLRRKSLFTVRYMRQQGAAQPRAGLWWYMLEWSNRRMENGKFKAMLMECRFELRDGKFSSYVWTSE